MQSGLHPGFGGFGDTQETTNEKVYMEEYIYTWNPKQPFFNGCLVNNHFPRDPITF